MLLVEESVINIETTGIMADGDKAKPNELEFSRDGEVWFDDGNIIILAGPGAPVPGRQPVEGGEVYGFRCHKSVLGKHSPVFGDMFENPPGLADLRLYDTPVVALSDDWQDVRDLLRTFYAAQCVLVTTYSLPLDSRHTM